MIEVVNQDVQAEIFLYAAFCFNWIYIDENESIK